MGWELGNAYEIGNMAPIIKKLKKGALLFSEGDPSKSMYYIQGGSLRLFKKKGAFAVELGLVYKGEIIGEMGFLDGGARSASAEALSDTDLVEITNLNLAEQLKTMPSWLLSLLKTIVNRLRNASNKIRQLETTTTSYNYSEETNSAYQFLAEPELLKILTACLLVASRSSSSKTSGDQLNLFASQVMGVHVTKIIELLNILETIGVAQVDRSQIDKPGAIISDPEKLEFLIQYLCENSMNSNKKLRCSTKAVLIMGYLVKSIDRFNKGSDGTVEMNLAQVIQLGAQENQGKEPFCVDEYSSEVVKTKVGSPVDFKDAQNAFIKVNSKLLEEMYCVQKFLKEIDKLNEAKRDNAARGGPSKYTRTLVKS